jgi:hypothetical protein
MTPEPFNTVADLAGFTTFRQGAATGVDSVREGTFPFSAFAQALRDARREIHRRTGERPAEAFSDARFDDLREAELWLATARLYPRFGERIILSFPESNIQATGEVKSGADTPPPLEKGQAWIGGLYQQIRAIGLSILYGQPWDMATDPEATTVDYDCLLSQ